VEHSTLGLDSVLELSWGEVLFIIIFLGSVAIAMIGHNQTFTSATRAPEGRVWGMCNRILLGCQLFPVTRLSPFTLLLGISHDRMVKYHRMMGRLLLVSMTIHFGIMADAYGASYITKWDTSIKMTFDPNVSPAIQPLPGLLSWICLVVMALTAFEPIRRRMWNAFLVPHFMLFIPVIVFACLHDRWTFVMVVISGSLYLADVVRRTVRLTKSTEAQIEPLGVVATKITITQPGFTWEPGQYVFLVVGGAAHPFSIANAPTPEAPHTFKLVIKNMGPGKFTDDLNKMSTIAPAIDGPYGNLSVPLDKYPAVCIVAGGVGITAMASVLDFMIRGDYKNIGIVTFVWVVREESLIAEFAPLLTRALAKAKVIVHYSGSVESQTLSGVATVPGRPKFQAIFEEAFFGQLNRALYVCGPDPMVVDVINHSRALVIPADVHQERFYF
jgi:NAD(P)H-flavin reductase